MVTLLFLPNGGLVSTISYSPCLPASASFTITGTCVASLPDAVKQEVHAAEPRDAIDQLDAAKLLGVQKRELFLVELVVIANEIVRGEQETAGAAGRIANRLVTVAAASHRRLRG